MPTDELIRCACTSHLCSHHLGDMRCDRPVTDAETFTSKFSTGPAEFTRERTEGFCKECEETLRKHAKPWNPPDVSL
jgi:hypothetical protein